VPRRRKGAGDDGRASGILRVRPSSRSPRPRDPRSLNPRVNIARGSRSRATRRRSDSRRRVSTLSNFYSSSDRTARVDHRGLSRAAASSSEQQRAAASSIGCIGGCSWILTRELSIPRRVPFSSQSQRRPSSSPSGLGRFSAQLAPEIPRIPRAIFDDRRGPKDTAFSGWRTPERRRGERQIGSLR
jgi:hypothetical protein